MIGMRWAIRGVGLISMVILARVLTPADFGIVAMSSLVSGLLAVFLDMGTWQLLLRMGDPDRDAYDTAWTLGLVQSCLMSIIVFLAAYPAALYFKEPRLVAVMQVLAAGNVLEGFSNIGVVMFRRDLDFRRDFTFNFVAKLLGAIPTVILALIFRSYWALVAGTLISNAIGVATGYVMHPFRPRLSLARWREFLSFSLWITPSSFANFLGQKADVFVVGYIGSAAQMGAYNVAAELSRMATAEVVTPMARALYPNYVKLKDDLAALTEAYLVVLRTVGIICFSFGFGVAAVGRDLVHVILGPQWDFAAPLMVWLSIFGAFSALQSTVAGHILVVLNRERVMFFITWSRLLLFAASVVVAARFGGVQGVAVATALATAGLTLACMLYLPRVLKVSTGRILLEMFSVFGAGLLMFVVVRLLHSDRIASPAVTLAIDALTGAIVFAAALSVSWVLAGRPDGLEKRIWGMMSNRVRLPFVRC
jgi:lipopolysaccharide exporter